MNNCTSIFKIFIIFSYLFHGLLAKNNYYLISIRRSSNDKEYDKESITTQIAINRVVNDIMNDIYEIIEKHKETYALKDGSIDEKLNELKVSTKLRKRGNNEKNNNKKMKFHFISNNRPFELNNKKNNNNNIKENNNNNNNNKNNNNSNKNNNSNYIFKSVNKKIQNIVEYTPMKSELVKSICPVLNYYVIRAYLSDEVVKIIKGLPNVISCKISKRTVALRSIENNNNVLSNKYYNSEDILKETKWKGLEIQENQFNDETLAYSHLSLISQGQYKYTENSNYTYDNNYYFPSTAGKGIDLYVIDSGLKINFHEADFDTYKNTPDERIITCDGRIENGEFNPVFKMEDCLIESLDDDEHGTLVSIAAIGKINGVAKKANLHMLATDYGDFDDLTALDYIKQHATPHKTVVNISRGCEYGIECYSQDIQNKITELINYGIIIIVSAGNTYESNCIGQIYTSCEGVIPIGAISNNYIYDLGMEDVYEPAISTSYGECVTLFAPGTIQVSREGTNEIIETVSGTSFSSAITAGVVATIMSENSNINYTFYSMREKLIDLSLKDVIRDLDENTPNRFLNNGKQIVYQSSKSDELFYELSDELSDKLSDELSDVLSDEFLD